MKDLGHFVKVTSTIFGQSVLAITEKKDGAKTVPLGYRFRKMVPFLVKKVPTQFPYQCPFAKGHHQNSSQKGTVLRTTNWCPKGTNSVESFMEFRSMFSKLKIV